jgi:hypothetical protein
MDTMIQNITDWALSDISNLVWAVAAIAVLGAANGVRRSWSWASRRRR